MTCKAPLITDIPNDFLNLIYIECICYRELFYGWRKKSLHQDLFR